MNIILLVVMPLLPEGTDSSGKDHNNHNSNITYEFSNNATLICKIQHYQYLKVVFNAINIMTLGYFILYPGVYKNILSHTLVMMLKVKFNYFKRLKP